MEQQTRSQLLSSKLSGVSGAFPHLMSSWTRNCRLSTAELFCRMIMNKEFIFYMEAKYPMAVKDCFPSGSAGMK